MIHKEKEVPVLIYTYKLQMVLWFVSETIQEEVQGDEHQCNLLMDGSASQQVKYDIQKAITNSFTQYCHRSIICQKQSVLQIILNRLLFSWFLPNYKEHFNISILKC